MNTPTTNEFARMSIDEIINNPPINNDELFKVIFTHKSITTHDYKYGKLADLIYRCRDLGIKPTNDKDVINFAINNDCLPVLVEIRRQCTLDNTKLDLSASNVLKVIDDENMRIFRWILSHNLIGEGTTNLSNLPLLEEALSRGKLKIAKYILLYDKKSMKSAIKAAIRVSSIEYIEWIFSINGDATELLYADDNMEIAAKFGTESLFNLLLKYAPDESAIEDMMIYSARHGRVDILELIITSPINMSIFDEGTYADLASRQHYLGTHGKDIDSKDEFIFVLLKEATINNQFEVLKWWDMSGIVCKDIRVMLSHSRDAKITQFWKNKFKYI